jgi:AhpD family alkylhydroperoxidase
MPHLSPRDRELVALGAAMGSNCVPCIEYHIPQARKAGLSDSEISEAIRLADKVRQVPARKVLEVALQMLTENPTPSDVAQSASLAVPQK